MCIVCKPIHWCTAALVLAGDRFHETIDDHLPQMIAAAQQVWISCTCTLSHASPTLKSQVQRRADALMDEVLTSLVEVARVRNHFVRAMDPVKLARLEEIAATARAAGADNPLADEA